MRTYRPIALLAALVAAAGLAVAVGAGSAAADPTTLHRLTELFPNGADPSGRYVPSPVPFAARVATGDPGATLVHYEVQRRGGNGTWRTVASVRRSGSVDLPLADGIVRWHARAENGGVVGPWSSWIGFTVDSSQPATPVITVSPGPYVIGHQVAVTISSPDGRAASYAIGATADAALARGQDPCAWGGDWFCPTQLGGPVTITRTYVDSFVQLRARAFGRNQQRSPQVANSWIYPVADAAALDAAVRWPVPTGSSTRRTIAEAHGGPPLHVAPAFAETDQVIGPVFDGDPTFVVPSIVFDGTTTAQTSTAVVDTASSFSVAVVLPKPGTLASDMTVFDQPGVGGDAFSLVLTTDAYLRFCITTADATTTCVSQQALPYRTNDFFVARFDAPGRRMSLASTWSVTPDTTLPGTAAVRAVTGGIRFGGAGVPGTTGYRGLLGGPLVAAGWLDPDQVRDLFPPTA